MSGSNPAPETDLQPSRPSNDRLDSWKEVAAYLRRDESTVRRWEKEGLPIHRHRHKFRAAVFAYKSELDTWWNSTAAASGGRLEESAHPAAPGTQTAALGPPAARARVARVLVPLAVIVLLAGGYWG